MYVLFGQQFGQVDGDEGQCDEYQIVFDGVVGQDVRVYGVDEFDVEVV